MTVTIDSAQFQTDFNGIVAAAKNPRSVLLAAGGAVASQLKIHFRRKDGGASHSRGEQRSHFWRQVAQSVSAPQMESPNTVSVTVGDPRFAQRLVGGGIEAKRAKALTIPVEARAVGRTAEAFEEETGLKLFLVARGGGHFEKAVLAVKEGGGADGFTVEYALAPSVNQAADPSALPDRTTLEQAVLAQAQQALDRQLARDKPHTETA